MSRNYWLNLFTWKTWQEFLQAGAVVSGFRAARWKTMQRMKQGDYLICYLTGISRFVGILEVESAPFKDSSRIWSDEEFPCRVMVRLVSSLNPETAIPILSLRDKLSIFKDHDTRPNAWTGHVRGSPTIWRVSDGEAVIRAIEEAEKNPLLRPIDVSKLERRTKALPAKEGPVTVPGPEEIAHPSPDLARESSLHTEIQWLLLKLASDMGLDVWVARNDRNRKWQGNTFLALKGIRLSLPQQFDQATNRTVELIDVLWLKGNAIVAAFEVESTTSIYSGLLRISDLLAMQPNLNIPLYIVAPDERRERVIAEVNRPTFARLHPPLVEACKYIPFSALRERLAQVSSMSRYLRPEFIDEIAESCVADLAWR